MNSNLILWLLYLRRVLEVFWIGSKLWLGSLKMNTTLEYSTRVVQEGDRRCKKSTLNDLAYLTPLRIPLMNPVYVQLSFSWMYSWWHKFTYFSYTVHKWIKLQFCLTCLGWSSNNKINTSSFWLQTFKNLYVCTAKICLNYFLCCQLLNLFCQKCKDDFTFKLNIFSNDYKLTIQNNVM